MKRPPGIRPLHPRIIATMALVPFSIAAFIAAYLVANAVTFPWFLGASQAAIAWIVTIGLFVGAPFAVAFGGGQLIWNGCVDWTPQRRARVLTINLVQTAALITACVSHVWVESWAIVIAAEVALIGGGIAIILIARVCYSPPPRSGARLDCPACGYDLRGQRQCRCPECGREFALGDLLEPPAD